MGDIVITITAIPTATNTVSAVIPTSTSSSDSPHPSYWDTHKRWLIMVIVLGIGLILFAVAAVQINRYFERKRDKVTSGFNAGITYHSAPMTQSRGPAMYNNPLASDSRQRPLNPRLPSETSSKYPSRIRERELQYVPSMQDLSSNKSTQDVSAVQGDPIVKDWELPRAKLTKGKERVILAQDV